MSPNSELKVPIVAFNRKTSTIQIVLVKRVMIHQVMPLHHASTIAALLMVAAVALTSGCADTPNNSKKKAVSDQAKDPDALFSDEEIPDSGILSGTAGKTTKASTRPKSPSWSVPGSPQTASQVSATADDPSPAPADTVAKVDSKSTTSKSSAKEDRRWGIILQTFSGEDHAQLAEAACVQLRRRYPLLAEAFVREKANGSVVMVGRFTGTDDPAAKPLVKEVQALTDGNDRPFARSFLTRVDTARTGAMGAFDLRRARLANPTARTLYSVEVAVWSDFGSGEISVDEIRRKAEAFTAQLRAQGLPAFYNHDDDRRMSIVTIGIFGENAYNAKTTLYSDEVEAIKKRFPKLLVNGEDLLRPVRKGSKETTPETTLLVEVPR